MAGFDREVDGSNGVSFALNRGSMKAVPAHHLHRNRSVIDRVDQNPGEKAVASLIDPAKNQPEEKHHAKSEKGIPV